MCLDIEPVIPFCKPDVKNQIMVIEVDGKFHQILSIDKGRIVYDQKPLEGVKIKK